MLDYLKIRRDLHQIPEIGLEEYKTHAYLMQVIDGLTAGLDFVEIRTWRTGILVFIKGSSPDKTIGWRTDIDGLPMWRIQAWTLPALMKAGCMPADTICT